tara:strand:- start:182 stop:349 length:168 start_codon:yes stop_codon:yes gene_type:complete
MTDKITSEKFEKCTGHKPVNDDLERVNCPKAGKINHLSCGWNHKRDMPIFMVGKD